MMTKRPFTSAKKAVLISIAIILVVFVFLFINVNIVNRDEEFYTTVIPPQLELTDGTHYVTGAIKTKDWYYKKKGNKFYPSSDEDISAITKEIGDSDAYKPPGYTQTSILEYSGELILKCNSEHYPDRINLNIYKREGAILVPLESSLTSSESASQGESISASGSTFTGENISTSENTSAYENTSISENNSAGKNNFTSENSSASENTSASKNNSAGETTSVLENAPVDESALLSEPGCMLSGCPVFQPKEKGELTYKITAYWDEAKSSERGFYGKVAYEFIFINNVPIEFEISSSQSFPGELLTIFAKYAEENDNVCIESDLIKQEIPFYEYEKGKFVVIPLSYDLKPSEYIISLTVKNDSNAFLGKSQPLQSHEINVNILSKDFPIQYLTVSEEVDQSTRNDAAYEEYNKYVGAVRKTNTPVKMWDGVFIKPVEGRITTEYGMRRFVNNSPTSYRHSGIDIAANKGMPVMAANSGKVILARHLILTGNTVLIDHGYGIISWSYHMDSIKVKEGEDVKKGQLIGEVGSTGFSTGPHLHFAISVHDVFTNPWTLFEQEPILFK
jgi:murein DD-endopeptidase MepM/ murein hydrolase activator NlpD